MFWIVKVIPSEALVVAGVIWNSKSVEKLWTFNGAEYQTARASKLPPSVNCSAPPVTVAPPAKAKFAALGKPFGSFTAGGGGGLPVLIVYAAVATALAVWPAATAIASSVSLAPTLIGPVYTAEAVVGVVPLVV